MAGALHDPTGPDWQVAATDETNGVDVTAATTFTLAEADLVESAWLVAVTVTVAGEGTTAGAVYSPLPEIVPTVVFPPGMLFTAQFTEVFEVPVTVATKPCV
jgi:hypothetical protein